MATAAHIAEAGRRGGRLLQILGVGFGIAVGVGATIGGGILRTPGEVAGYMGTAGLTLGIWLVGGLYTLVCSSAVSELATMLPRAGGWYVYSERAFGKRIGFVVGCCDWMNQAVGIAFLSVALGEFAAELHPALSPYTTAIAITGLAALFLLNLIGLRSGSRTQALTSMVKALALVALVIGCFSAPGSAGQSSGTTHLPMHSPGLLLGWLLAFQAVIVSYDAWYTPMYFAEEDQNPTRNLPRSLVSTVLSCAAIFLLINGALIHVLGMERLQLAKVPGADASLAIFGTYGKQIFLLISIITVISANNATLMTAPRVLYGMARDRLLPQRLTSVNQGGTPAWALFLCLIVSIALICSGTFETLIAIDSVVIGAVYVSAFASLLVLRSRQPHLPRPYKTWWYPWSTLGALLVSLGFLCGAVIGDLRHSLFTVVLVALSYVASRLIVRTGAESA
ncbi:MAG: APC family permease [Gammaproteobacteria bacterium]|nr:APC family permease [Gammaproteobacteria bacterium]